MSFQIYHDPTLEKAAAMELRAKGCMVCERYKYLIDRHRCSVGKHLPACKREKNGFILKK